MKAKKVNISTETKPRVKIVDFYTDLFFMKERPVSEAFIERIAHDMVTWAKKDTSLRITQFFNELGIPNKMLYRWMEIYPSLRMAHDYTLSVIADRREVGAITKKYDGNYIKEMQPMYDPAYKSFLEWRAGLNKEKDTLGNIKVVIERFPEPKEVKE